MNSNDKSITMDMEIVEVGGGSLGVVLSRNDAPWRAQATIPAAQDVEVWASKRLYRTVKLTISLPEDGTM